MIDSNLLLNEMKEKSINSLELSRISGVDKSVISRILNGETRSCTVGTAQRIAEALNLDATKSGLIFFAQEVAQKQQRES